MHGAYGQQFSACFFFHLSEASAPLWFYLSGVGSSRSRLSHTGLVGAPSHGDAMTSLA